MAQLISEVLKGETVTVAKDTYLVAKTDREGYLPSREETVELHKGQYLFKVVDGAGGAKHVIPVVKSADGKTFVDDVKRPVVIAKGTEVTYVEGRNSTPDKEGYKGRAVAKITDIKVGELDKHLLLAFLEFARTEYSLGVNDFRVGGEELIAPPVAPPPTEG
ncbi:Ig-like protein [Bacillus phage vB_BceH_LY2]|nr:Ig-like protein [Bacillus phage vB_BceH_LY2]